MTAAYALSDTRVMIARCLRRSLRDPEAFFTALILPVVLMLLFVYVFGGAINIGGHYANYVVPGLIVLCAGFGAGTTAVAVATDGSAAAVHDLLGLLRNVGAPAARVSVERPSLDDVFLSLTAPKTGQAGQAGQAGQKVSVR